MGREEDKKWKRGVRHRLRVQCLFNGVPREEIGGNGVEAMHEKITADNFSEMKRHTLKMKEF